MYVHYNVASWKFYLIMNFRRFSRSKPSFVFARCNAFASSRMNFDARANMQFGKLSNSLYF